MSQGEGNSDGDGDFQGGVGRGMKYPTERNASKKQNCKAESLYGDRIRYRRPRDGFCFGCLGTDVPFTYLSKGEGGASLRTEICHRAR